MRSVSGDIINRTRGTRKSLWGKETFPELVHFCRKVMVPTLEVIAGVLPELAKLAEGGVAI